MPDMTIHEMAARLQTMTEPLNMQAQEIIAHIATGAMHASNVPMPDFKDITENVKHPSETKINLIVNGRGVQRRTFRRGFRRFLETCLLETVS